MEDSFLYKGQRQRLAQLIENKGISDTRIVRAIEKIPRHFFMENFLQHNAYKDQAQPIGSGQTISQPYTVAFQTELLGVEAGDKILEIGTGSGYQTAVLLELGAKVYTIERHRALYQAAHLLLQKLNYYPHFFLGDGYNGLPNYGPFDKILITAGAPYIPKPLIEQLKIGGIMVLPVGNVHTQKMISIVKTGEEEFEQTEFGDFLFVPMLKGVV